MKLSVPLFLAAALFCARLSADQALFRNASIGFGGGSVLDMKAADVNHDGKQDVILFRKVIETNVTPVCSIITMFGNGDGTFRAPVTTQVPCSGSIATGDLDGDGNVDVVWSGYDRLIEVYRGNSDGSFTLRSTRMRTGYLNAYDGEGHLVLADLNGDGKLDLITPASCCGQTETFRGNGDGTFADSVVQPDFVTALSGIVGGDFNGDGRMDVLVSTLYQRSGYYGRQSLMTGKGDGNFNAPTVLSTDGAIVAAGDFNGDLKTDYVAMGASNGFAFVHIGKGDGTFTTGATYITGVVSHAFPVDLDGDGKLDIVAAGNNPGIVATGSNIVTVMRGNGDGTFVVDSYVARSTAFVVADFDGDHHLDVLAGSDAALTFLHGNGDGSLAGYRKTFLETVKSAGAEDGSLRNALEGLAAADFNGDGKPDLVSKADGIVIMLNRGDGVFGPPLPLQVSNDAPATDLVPRAFAIGDVNRDGKADIVVMNGRTQSGTTGPYNNDLVTYLGNGDGTFQSTKPTPSDDFFGDLTLKDVNGDGKLDALIFFPTILSSHALLSLGNGDGTFSPLPIALPRIPDFVADIDGDGFGDLVSNSGFYADGYSVLRNNRNGTFTTKDAVFDRRAIAVGDFNHDGKPDVVDASYASAGGVVMRLGKGDGTFTDLPKFTVENLAGNDGPGLSPKTVTGDFDGDGNLDLAFENQILLGKGDGTFRAIVPCVVARIPPSYPWDRRAAVDLAAGDVDGNGSDDLVLLDRDNVAVSTLLTRTTAAGTTPLSLSASTSMSTLHPGESVVVTVTSSTSSTNVPSGGIRIDDNGAFAALATWKDGSASATVAPPSTGKHTFTASYVGDDVFAAASAAVTQTAVQLDTQLQLGFYPETPQVKGQTFVQADVFPKQTSTTLARGTITIREGETVLFTGPYRGTNNVPRGNASTAFTYRFPTIGTHSLTLDYSGDENYPAASLTVAVPVTKAFGSVQLTTSPNTLNAGNRLTVQARVTAYHNLSCCEEFIDGGTVTFRDRNAVIGTVTLVRGYASVTIQPAAGYHSFTATYEGNVFTDPVTSESTDYIVDAVPCAPASNCSRRRAVH
jgi:hypothetical protein